MATAYFFISKIVWFLIQPLDSLVVGLLVWLGCRRLGWRALARGLMMILLIYAGAIFLTPLPEFAVRTLENRFPVPQGDLQQVAGIIVLGGATDDGAIAAARGQPLLNGAAERLTTAIALHRAMPDKPFIVSGFSGSLNPRGWNEAQITERFFEQQGIDPSSVRFEAKSRNTAENARLTAAMLGQAGQQTWLLVTSASHMPRAVASFRALGVAVLPYPVDFHTEAAHLVWPRDLAGSLGMAQRALHEWVGLLAYYVTGYSDELLPGPR